MFTTEGGGKRLKIEPESAEVVKLIFDMREQGNSMVKIAEHLNHNNIAAPRNHYYKRNPYFVELHGRIGKTE